MEYLIQYKGFYLFIGARFIVPGLLPYFLTSDLLFNFHQRFRKFNAGCVGQISSEI